MKYPLLVFSIIITYVIILIFGYSISNYLGSSEDNKRKRDLVSKNIDDLQLKIDSAIHERMEYAYFEGQKDALNGDWRISKKDSCYFWTKSCWDNTSRKILYVPGCK